MTLVVSQNNRRVGLLDGTADRGVVFLYDPHYLADPNARAISHSLPLQKQGFSSKQCLPFFSGLLPDGGMRRRIGEYLQVSESSTLRLLEALGRECAGSAVLREEVDPKPNYSVQGTYRRVEEDELAAMIRHMDVRPLLLGSSDLRQSLAGAQQKISLARFSGDWYLPLDGAASSHILKPSKAPFHTLAVNEFLCKQLAKMCTLPVADTELVMVEDIPVFVTERYDRRRVSEHPPVIERIPQEDACQDLGIMPDRKYEEDGGPGLGQLATLVQKLSATPILGLQKLLHLGLYLMGRTS
jgi:serine/threonine-protein kinase HipA